MNPPNGVPIPTIERLAGARKLTTATLKETGEQFPLVPERSPMLPAVIEDLHVNITSLEDTLTRLSVRLAPITSEYPPTPPMDEKNAPSAPSLVNSVRYARNRVVELNDSVTTLIAHLEV